LSPYRVAFWDVFGASNLLTGPPGPLSNALLPKTSQKAIKTSAVYEFMTWSIRDSHQRDLPVTNHVSKLVPMKKILTALLLLFIVPVGAATANPSYWKHEWPRTDFTKHSVAFEDILSGGPPKGGIPSIDNPKFVPVSKETELTDTDPVIGLIVNGVAKAYPLRVLIWHEIVNDTIGNVPVTVTFCPLCNTAVVYDRRLDGKVLDFGTTGKTLKAMPARLESWAKFKARAPQGQVLVPEASGMRNYGATPYGGYDSLPKPFLYSGELPKNVPPLSRVVSTVDRSQAWSLALLQRKKEIRLDGGLILRWEAGQISALDTTLIAKGADVGNVTVQRDGSDIPYFVDFVFAFHAFFPKATIHDK